MYNITYIIRGINKSINEDKEPKKAHFSLQFDKNQYIKEFYNPTIDKNKNKLMLDFNEMFDNVEYIQVIVQIKDKVIIEYLSYDIYSFIKSKSSVNIIKRYIILFIIIGVLLFILTIGLIFVLIIFKNKNKDLLDKVKKVSFVNDKEDQPDNENGNKDGLLYNNDENYLS